LEIRFILKNGLDIYMDLLAGFIFNKEKGNSSIVEGIFLSI